MLSVLEGMGRRVWKQILAASERNSTQLLINAHRPVNGQITLNKDTNPNYGRKAEKNVSYCHLVADSNTAATKCSRAKQRYEPARPFRHSPR